MGLFRKSRARVVRRGVGDQVTEERTTKNVGGSTVEVRRVREIVEPKPKAPSNGGGSETKQRSGRKARGARGRTATTQRPDTRSRRPEPVFVPPPETERKQMLVRRTPHQTQIVVLEGALLVEHYVARSDRRSLAGNVYLGRVRNVLPGMEAAFVDFGESKNGVLYASDVQTDAKNGRRKARIEEALAVGDEIVVQVVKDAMGHKGARLTNQISLAGRYLVLAPESDMRGISRRLPDEERERLRRIIADVRPSGHGVIVRTAAEGASQEELAADIDRLRAQLERIQEEIPAGGTPRLIYQEPPLVLRVIREHFTRDFRRLLIDDPEINRQVTEYLEETDPELLSRVQPYEDELPLFERFHVEDQLRKALDRKVWLPSGGHIVIDRTEALTVVDVNTGKFVGHSSLEDTVLQNNLEAADEIARQLRLRDIGGIIVIDFIDMEVSKNRDAVIHKLRESLARDKTRTQVFEVSHLGLVEMTRKNVSEGLLESFSHVCPECGGRGVVLYEEAATSGARMPAPESDD
ncbi:MAG TPA: Rne/Rng family ribonuclease [Acidimicrobiia bacterium]|nr:Rne/Rng family ribonuclease [Acidimicrobiia bacterium]